jgi:uncharacterized protein YuzE
VRGRIGIVWIVTRLCLACGAVAHPIRFEVQERNRYRFWTEIPELDGRYLKTMRVNYYPETDSLYIDLSEQTSVESREISEGVVLDYDSRGDLVGIDIDNASTKIEIHKLIVSQLPGSVETIPG